MAEERIDIVVAQKGATEVRRDLEGIGAGARASIPGLDGMRSAIDRINAAASATAGPTSQLRNAMAALGPSVTAASLGIQTLGPASQVTMTQFGSLQGQFARTTGALSILQTGLTGTATATMALGAAGGGAVPPINNLTGGINAAGNASNQCTPAVNGLTMSFFSLWRVLLLLAVIRQIAGAIADSIDTWTQMSNKLRQVSTDAQNLVATQEAVYRSAQLTRSGMEEIATLYSRTAQATKVLGLSQREVMDVTETVAMAMKLNGGSVTESANAMRQLSQAFNKGKLDGDEFKSIMENAPALQRAFSQALGVSTGELMRMSKAGELTLPKLIDALQKAGPEIRAQFGESLPLIAEGFTYVGNSITRFLGQLNEATGFSLSFYNAMRFIGDNLGILGAALIGIGAAVLVAFGPAAVAAVVGFAGVVAGLLGPLALVVGALAAATAAVYLLGDSWQVTADGVTVLDYVRALIEALTGAVPSLTTVLLGVGAAILVAFNLGPIIAFGAVLLGALLSPFGLIVGALALVVGGLYAMGVSMEDVRNATVTVVGGILGLFIGLYNGIVEAFRTLPGAFVAIFQLAMNGSIQVVQDGLNGIIGAVNSVLERLSVPIIPAVDLSTWKSEVDSTALDAGTKIAEAFDKGMAEGNTLAKDGVNWLGGALEGLTQRAKELMDQRKLLDASKPTLSTVPGENNYEPPTDGGKAVAKLQEELNSLLRTIDPITGAQEKLRQGTETLNKAYEAGLITMERRDDLLTRLRDHMRDQLDPLGAINREMEKEAALLRLGNDEREVQEKLLDDIEKLRKAGVTLAPIEKQQLEDSIRAMQQLRIQSELLGSVLERTFKGAEDAFIEFIETGKVSFSSLITSLISDVARLAFQSFVTRPLVNVLGNVLGGLLPGAGSTFSGLNGLFSGGNYFPPAPTGLYATGGSFTVGGQGGVDSQLVQFRASPGERVQVSRAGDSSDSGANRPTQMIFNIHTPDVAGFKASESQIAARMQRLASRGSRNL